jgi:hypothetical protein
MRRTLALLFLFPGILSASAHNSTDHWFEVRTQHFVVLTDTNEKQAHRVASQFERMRAVFHQASNGKSVSLYRNDFNQIEFTAANFTPQSDLNPCTDIEGLKAKVQYAEVSDKSVAGQIISVELSKKPGFSI